MKKLQAFWQWWKKGYKDSSEAVCGLALVIAIYGIPLWCLIIWFFH